MEIDFLVLPSITAINAGRHGMKQDFSQNFDVKLQPGIVLQWQALPRPDAALATIYVRPLASPIFHHRQPTRRFAKI
jgi:hypothetical protein